MQDITYYKQHTGDGFWCHFKPEGLLFEQLTSVMRQYNIRKLEFNKENKDRTITKYLLVA